MKEDNLTRFLDKIGRGKMPVGAVTTFADAAVTEVVAAAGFDFVWVDGEHGIIDRKTAQDHLIAAQANGIASFYRVPSCDHTEIKRIIDLDPDAIIVPMVMDEKDAARAASACRYAIRGGDRGCGYRRGIRYGAIDVKAYLDDSARRPYVIIQLEHIEAVRHLDAILSVPGVDGVLIGPYDLSMSMCKPGDWEDPEVAAVFDDCCRRVKASASAADADVNPHDFTVFLPRDASTHYGNSCYSSFTVTDGTGVLWYPDNKRRLYGVRIPDSCAIGLD